jgi:hypothetical protein
MSEEKVIFIEGKKGQITTGYDSGKRVIEFDDKRKKTVVEYVG